MIEIHSTAVVHPSAKLGKGVLVGPYCIIGEGVTIGEGTVLGPHVVVEPMTTVGRDCQLHAGAVLGGIPQDLKFEGEESSTIIGDRNVIREYVTINRATGQGEVTRIGDDNLLMAYVHVAHNCVLGNRLVLSNGVTLAGHVQLEDYAGVGGMTGVHQFTRIGTMAYVGGMTKVTQDVPPFALVEGNPPMAHGLNIVGLRRRGVSPEDRQLLKRAYRLLYRSGLRLGQAIEAIEALEAERESVHVRHLLGFLRATERGLVGLSAGLSGQGQPGSGGDLADEGLA